MSLLTSLLQGLRSLFRKVQVNKELDEELNGFLEMAAEEKMKQGMSRNDALRAVRLERGNLETSKEVVRSAGWESFVEICWQDLRFAARMLRKKPGFTATAVLTLALGVGATTAIFSVVYGVLLRPLPYRNPEQLVRLWEQSDDGRRMAFADPNFEDVRTQSHSMAGIAEYNSFAQTIVVRGEAATVSTANVSHDFFHVLGVEPILGRRFDSAEQQFDAATTALISYAYWQTLGSPLDLSSIHLRIRNKPAAVVGVLPAGFRFPDYANIWVPREISARSPSRMGHNWQVIGRLRPGVTTAQARSELFGIAQRLKQQFGQDTLTVAVAIEPLRDAMTSDVRPALWILLAASGFLLLIACANVINLMLAQATGRERELSIRAALGASRARLISQFLLESFVLATLSGAFGVVLAYWGVNALLALAPKGLPRIENVSINVPVLLFSLSMVTLVSLALGIFTALRSVSANPQIGIKEGARGGTGTVSKHRAGRVLSAAQLAAALVLLIGAGLLGRSLLRILTVDSGFRTQGVVTMELSLPEAAVKTERIDSLNRLLARLRQIPGVQQVGGVNVLPLASSFYADGWFVPMNPGQISPHVQELIQLSATADIDKDPNLLEELGKFFDEIFRDRSHLVDTDYVAASEGYFKALGIPLLRGRLFDERDAIDTPHVAVISQSLAAERWPNEDPIGRTIEFGNMDGDLRLLTIVGVVGDIRDHSLEAAPRATIYVNWRQRPQSTSWSFTVVMLSSGSPDTVYSAARALLRDLDPNIPSRFRTLSQVYSASLEERRFSLTLISVFSVAALLLALAGIYGVISYSVAQRTREIGVRMTLGASTREVLRMVLSQGVFTGMLGISAGVLGALVLTRWLRSELFEVSATDPTTFAAVALLLFLVSLLACWIPARRATRVDPMVALRYE